MNVNQKSLLLKWGNSLCMFLFTFLLFYLYIKYFVHWDTFTSRDIMRAQGWLNGQFYLPGPEMNGGGNLPGPFFYFLLFPPLLFGDDIYSYSLLWYVSWFALTYTMAFYFAAGIIKHKESLLVFLIIFIAAIGYPLFSPLSFAWNPGFSIFFHILAVIGLYHWKKTNKDFYLYLVGLNIALGIQIHLLMGVHIITIFLFYLLEKKRKFLPILLCFFLVSFPVLIYSVMNYLHVFKTSSSNYIGYLYHLTGYIFSEEWFKTVKQMIVAPYILPIPFFITFWKKWKVKKWIVTKSTKDLFIIIAIPCFIGILFSSTMSRYIYFLPVFSILLLSKWLDDFMPNNANKRLNYLLFYGFISVFPIFLSNNVTTVLFSGKFLRIIGDYHIILLCVFLVFLLMMNTKWTNKNFWKVGIFFLFLLVALQIRTIKILYPWQPSIQQSVLKKRKVTHQYLYPLMKHIYLETKWLPREAMRRIYIVGMHSQISLLSHYSMTKEIAEKKGQVLSLRRDDVYRFSRGSLKQPDGYIIIQNFKQFTNYSKKDWEKYLSQSSLLSDFLRREIAEKKVLIQSPKLYDIYWLIPYKTTQESVFIEGFGNIGQPYYWEEPEWLKNCSFTQKFQNENGFFYCMILPGHLQRAGIHIKFSNSVQKNVIPPIFRSHLEISFFGSLIGTGYYHDNLDGRAIWSNIQITLLCGKTHFMYNIPNIGVVWKKIESILEFPSIQKQRLRVGFTSPLRLWIPIDKISTNSSSFSQTYGCKKKNIKEITLAFTHSHTKTYDKQSLKKINIVWNQ